MGKKTCSIQIIKVTSEKKSLWLKGIREENLKPEVGEKIQSRVTQGLGGYTEALGFPSECCEKPGISFEQGNDLNTLVLTNK